MADRDDDLAAIDEILQVMYWMRGEHLAQVVTPRDLGRMLTGVAESRIGVLLERLERQGLVARGIETAGAYALTDAGVREGGRRFADEFADLTKPGHGECGDPDCECQRTGSPDDCRHRATHLE
jgi:DNA-binding PadR family transcriptional regulator